MFKMSRFARLVVLVVLSVGIQVLIESSTVSGQTVAHEVTLYRSESELSKNAIMLDEKSLMLAAVDKESRSLAFPIDHTSKTLRSKLKKGTVLIGGVSANTPEGLLVKVVDASEKDGALILQTKPALLTEAFKNLSLEAQVRLFCCSNEKGYIGGCFERDIFESLDAVLYDQDGVLIRTVDSYFDVYIEFCLGIEIVDFQLVYAHFDPYIDEQLKVVLEATGERDFDGSATLWESDIGAVWIGPIVIVPQLGISANAYGRLDGTFTTGIGQQFCIDYTLDYSIDREPVWDVRGGWNKSFNFIEPVITGNAEATVSLTPELVLKLYGVAGPFVNVEGGFMFTGELQAGKSLDICWNVSTLLKASGGVKLDVGPLDLESPELGLFSLDPYILAQGRINAEAPVTHRFTDIRNTTVSAGGTVGPISGEATNNTGSYYEYYSQKYITDPTGATTWFSPQLRSLAGGVTEPRRGRLNVASGAIEGEYSAGIVFTDLAGNEIEHDWFSFTVTGGTSKSPGADDQQGWEYRTTGYEDND